MSTDVLVFADSHLGSAVSRVTIEDIAEIVHSIKPLPSVYFTGDTFEIMVSDKNKKFVQELHTALRDVDHTFLSGNHDNVFAESFFVGSKGDKKFMLRHGNEQDPTWVRLSDPFLVPLTDMFMRLTGIDLKNWSRKRSEKQYPEGKFVPRLYRQRCQMIAEYQNSNIDVLVSGHTHYPELSKHGKLIYANPGPNGFVRITDSDIQLRGFRREKGCLSINEVSCLSYC